MASKPLKQLRFYGEVLKRVHLRRDVQLQFF